MKKAKRIAIVLTALAIVGSASRTNLNLKSLLSSGFTVNCILDHIVAD